jgi:hypothetical protein
MVLAEAFAAYTRMNIADWLGVTASRDLIRVNPQRSKEESYDSAIVTLRHTQQIRE